MNMTTTNMTPEGLKEWAKENKELAETVCMAKALVECERERVDAYILPIFQSFDFRNDNDDDGDGSKITDPKELYLTKNDELCAKYYEACDVAHRANGFEGPKGHCPVLTAEALQTQAEVLLVTSLGEFVGVGNKLTHYGVREKSLDLALTACLGKIV